MKKLILVCSLVCVFVPTLAQSGVLVAGWNQSDLGLENEGNGFYFGYGNEISLASDLFDASYSFDYVQKRASQLTLFVDPVAGFNIEDAEVTLHMVEPSISLGLAPATIPLHPRLYVGGTIGLKIKEDWSDFPGEPVQEYGYKDTNFSAHLGFSIRVGQLTLDTRWTKSLSGQLLIDNQDSQKFAANKADDELAGVHQPEEGFKTETWQIGIAVEF